MNLIAKFASTAPLEAFETADFGEVTSSSTFDDFSSTFGDFSCTFDDFKAAFGFIAEDNSTFRALDLRAVDGGRGGLTLRGIVIVSGSFSLIVTRFLDTVEGKSSMRPRPPDEVGDVRGRFAGLVDCTFNNKTNSDKILIAERKIIVPSMPFEHLMFEIFCNMTRQSVNHACWRAGWEDW